MTRQRAAFAALGLALLLASARAVQAQDAGDAALPRSVRGQIGAGLTLGEASRFAGRIGVEGQLLPLGPSLLGGRVLLASNAVVLGAHQDFIALEPRVTFTHAGPAAPLVGFGLGVSYIENDPNDFCIGLTRGCAEQPITTGFGVFASAHVGLMLRFGGFMLVPELGIDGGSTDAAITAQLGLGWTESRSRR